MSRKSTGEISLQSFLAGTVPIPLDQIFISTKQEKIVEYNYNNKGWQVDSHMDFLTSFKIGLDLLWTILTAEPMLTLTLLMLFLCALIWAFLIDFIRQQRLKKSGILEVDNMTGKVFEEFLKGLLKHKGYKVGLTSITGDYGADLILSTNDKKIVVQAKRYKKKVGIKAVQEIVSAKNHYQADECWVITNNYYTAPAVNLAASNNVVLIDRSLLMKWMLERNKGA